MTNRITRSACACLVALTSMIASAQSVLLETVTMTAAREAVRVYVQELHLQSEAEGRPVLFPGTAPASGLHVSPDADSVVLATSETASGRAEAFRVAAFERAMPRIATDGWRAIPAVRIAGLVANAEGSPVRIVGLSAIDTPALRSLGRIDVWNCTPEPGLAIDRNVARWMLPGVPGAATTHPRAGWVAVLCRTPNGAIVLHVRDVVRGRVLKERLPLARAEDTVEPAGIALEESRGVIVALLNETDVSPNDEGRCYAIMLDARTHGPIGEPIELPGLYNGSPISFATNGTCWISTRSPSAGFGYLVRLDASTDGYTKVAQHSFTGLSRDALVASNSDGSFVAVAVERRLELWPNGEPGGNPMSYNTPIRALAWTGSMLLAAEANQLHGVRTSDGMEVMLRSVQTGQIVAIHPVPTESTVPVDSDNDSLPDHIDPEPTVPSPTLAVPTRIVVHREAAGKEVRAVLVDSPLAANSVWRVEHDPAATPWLRVFPQQGRVPGWFIVELDPSHAIDAEETGATITVSMSGAGEGAVAAGSPQRVHVEVQRAGKSSHAVLWLLGTPSRGIRNATASGSMTALFDLLSNAPFYWSHVVPVGRAAEPLDAYAVVVLDADAIARGIVSRQALIDYVTNGGGLLVLAGATSGNPEISARWLAPVGITMDASANISGEMRPTVTHAVTRHITHVAIARAARLRVDTASSVLAAIGDEPALVVRTVGRGRIAVLATSSPLEADALENEPNRAAAKDLFEWLSRGILETADLDGDSLSDALEDRNDNGIVDRGETSLLNPDSDGDGLPDGKEDQNANGVVDDGETSPINPDTDNDGNYDGADYDPLPSLEAPVAVALLPYTGPAEGGTRVMIDGRNLGADAKVWFGARPAVSVGVTSASGLLVESPPSDSDEGGAVDVRVENPGAQGTVLPGGFIYTPRSNVELGLIAVAAATAQYEGTVTVTMSAPPSTRVGRITMRLDSQPEGQLEWFDLQPTQDAMLAGRRSIQRNTGEWGIAFEVTAPTRSHDAQSLAVVRCRSRYPLEAGTPTELVLRDVVVLAPNGEPLSVQTRPATLRWSLPGHAPVAAPEPDSAGKQAKSPPKTLQ